MGLFRRRRDAADASSDTTADTADTPSEQEPATPARSGPPRDEPRRAAYQRSEGPLDRGEVGGPGDRVDLGALWVTPVPGMEMRLEVDEQSGDVQSVTVLLGESQLQLSAFAAPRTAGIWDEVRAEIAAGVSSAGGTADDVDGPLGLELRAMVPGRGPDGRAFVTPARFVGVDGPRWFLRGVLTGRSAVEPDAAQALLGVYRATVVVRGDEAMAPRDPLPLRLPEALAPGGDAPAGDDTRGAADELRPFERGPEITEVR